MFTAVLTLSTNVVVVGGLDNKPIKSREDRRDLPHTVGGGSKNIKTLVCLSY